MQDYEIKNKANCIKQTYNNIKKESGMNYDKLTSYYYQYEELASEIEEVMQRMSEEDYIYFNSLVGDILNDLGV